MRKLGASMKPVLTISRNGDLWKYKSESSVKTTEFDFKFGQEFEETTADGRKVKV
jgi:Lipocalin / cytosolic fatty-acid binding protein family